MARAHSAAAVKLSKGEGNGFWPAGGAVDDGEEACATVGGGKRAYEVNVEVKKNGEGD